jgi:hypothetical protein
VSARRARRRTRDCGQIVITFALSLALFLFGVIAMVMDLSVMYAARATALQAAQDAAVAGASDVDTGAFLTSSTSAVTLNGSSIKKCEDVGLAESKTFPFINLTGSATNCYYNGPTRPGLSCPASVPAYEEEAIVVIKVTFPVPFPGGGSPGVTACYVAAAQAGTSTPFGQ